MTKQDNGAFPQMGERALIIGQTGSGKTNFAVHILKHIPFAPWVIYDTKDEDKFLALPKSVMVTDEKGRDDAIQNPEIDFVIVRPPAEISTDEDAMDAMLQSHYNDLHETGAYIDEAYSFHKNGRAGKGYNSLLTRGRSRGITVISSTQRPAWISKFLYSEAQHFYLFYLGHEDDRKHVARFVPGFDPEFLIPKHHFFQFSQGNTAPQLFEPVPLAKPKKQEYKTETVLADQGIARLKNENINTRKVNWIPTK